MLVEGTPEEIKAQCGRAGSLSRRSARAHEPARGQRTEQLLRRFHILFDVSLRVERNEVVALLGRNGAGKSTTLKSLMGVVTPARRLRHVRRRRNRRQKEPRDRAGRHAARARRTAAFSAASDVEENLILAGLTAPNRWPLERVYAMFPRLKERRAQPRHRSFRRRAADAGDRARAGTRAENLAARRAVRGPGAGYRARPDGGLPQARRGRTDHRAGGAESGRESWHSRNASTSSTMATLHTKVGPRK